MIASAFVLLCGLRGFIWAVLRLLRASVVK